jgi:hypothetical protein
MIYLTMVSITKNIIKYGLQPFTSVMKSETITLAICNRSAATQAVKYHKQILCGQTFIRVAFMATPLYIYKQGNSNNNCITISRYNSIARECLNILVYMNFLFPNKKNSLSQVHSEPMSDFLL